MPSIFETKKHKILDQLAIPSEEYTDASPKGSVDAPIRALVKDINAIPSLVTTSTCSGRIAIFAEGLKHTTQEDDSKTLNPQGKGTGAWLFVSHLPLSPLPLVSTDSSYLSTLLADPSNEVGPVSSIHINNRISAPIPLGASLLHLKFEPLILHILCADLTAARKLLIAAQGAGYRESGISSVPKPPPATDGAHEVTDASEAAQNPDQQGEGRKYSRRQRKSQKGQGDGPVMVAVRTTGLTMDAPLGYRGKQGEVVLCVSDAYLGSVVGIANDRFTANEERKSRLQDGILKAFEQGVS